MGILFSIIGFWKGLPAPARRFLQYAAVLAVVLWGFKVFWLNPHDARVAAAERMRVTEDIRKAAEQSWRVRYDELKQQNTELERRTAELQLSNEALVRSREAIVSSLNKSLSTIKAIGDNAHAQDSNVPDYMLDSVLRDVSTALLCAKPGNIGRPECRTADTR